MRRGFSLLELVVALAVIGVTFAVALPALPDPADPSPLDEAVAETLGTLRSARREALRSGQTVEVTIDTRSRRYWVRQSVDTLDVSGQLSTSDGVALQSPGPRVRFVFRPDGTTLSEPLSLVVAGRAVSLTVDPWSGRVDASR